MPRSADTLGIKFIQDLEVFLYLMLSGFFSFQAVAEEPPPVGAAADAAQVGVDAVDRRRAQRHEHQVGPVNVSSFLYGITKSFNHFRFHPILKVKHRLTATLFSRLSF